jgi:hypothetical protein
MSVQSNYRIFGMASSIMWLMNMNGLCLMQTHNDILELWFLSECPWWRVAVNKEATEPRVPLGKVEDISTKILRLHDLVDRYGISVSQTTTDMLVWRPPSCGWWTWMACALCRPILGFLCHWRLPAWTFGGKQIYDIFKKRFFCTQQFTISCDGQIPGQQSSLLS